MHSSQTSWRSVPAEASAAVSMATPGTRKRALEQASVHDCPVVDENGSMARVKAFSSLDTIRSATQHLAAADPRLQDLITSFGPPERLLTKTSSCFRSLAKSILYQQLAGTAAAAIYSRFLAVCGVRVLLLFISVHGGWALSKHGCN